MKKATILICTIFTLIGCSPSELDKCIDSNSNSYTNTAYEDYRVGEYIEAWVFIQVDDIKSMYIPEEELASEAVYARNLEIGGETEGLVFDGFFKEENSDRDFYEAQLSIIDSDITLEAEFKNYSKADWSALEMKYINELKTIAKNYNDRDNASKESAEKICNRQGIY